MKSREPEKHKRPIGNPKRESKVLRLSAMISHCFTQFASCLFLSPHGNEKVI
jgi:hypothetical protein